MKILVALAMMLLSFETPAADLAAREDMALRAAEAFVAGRLERLPRGSTVVAREVFLDDLEQAHVRYQHHYQGVPVFESELIVHVGLVSAAVIGTTDALLHFGVTGTQPVIGAADAHARALEHFSVVSKMGGRDDLMLMVKDGVAFLTWRVHALGQDKRGPVDKIAFVDAMGGGVLRSWNNLHTAAASGTGAGYFNGVVQLTTDLRSATTNPYRLLDPTRGGQYTCDMLNRQANCYAMDDADNYFGDGKLSNRQTAAVDAQYGTAATWDYFRSVHSRTGVGNDGKASYNRVHYSKNYSNAFWSDACMCMTFGDGDGVTYNPFVSLDVTGHEMSHGVTAKTARLTYSGESGGLNEATSDIFGAMVELYANNASDAGDYLVGEKVFRAADKALRYMFQPSRDGRSADCWYPDVGALGVHYSSGVANHFFYLLAEGTAASSAALPGSQTCGPADVRIANGTGALAGIGRGKAEKIWYRGLTVYMTSSTNYAAARTATLSAARDLYGQASPEVDAVAAAWTAVNVK